MELKIASKADIEHAQKEWNALVESMRVPSIFLTWEWVVTWIKHFGVVYDKLVLFVYQDQKLVAIMPLAVCTKRLENGIQKLKVLSFCGSIELFPDYLDIICSKDDDAVQYIECIFNFLLTTYKDWDMMYLGFLLTDSALLKYVQSKNFRLLKIKDSEIIAPYIPEIKDIDTFLTERMNQKRRHELRRQKRVLYEKKGVSIKKIDNEADLTRYVDDLFRLHKIRKDHIQVDSTFIDDTIMSFHREIAQKFLQIDRLRYYIMLDRDNNPIAAAYGFVYDNKYHFYQSGMDPQWSKESPGKIIIMSILEDLFSDEIKELDFLSGDQEYKFIWTDEKREMVTYTVYNKKLLSVSEYVIRVLIKKIKYCINKHLR